MAIPRASANTPPVTLPCLHKRHPGSGHACAFAPPSLIIDYLDQSVDFTAKDEEGLTLALRHRDCVRRVRIMRSVSILQNLVISLDGEFPILEYLFIECQRYTKPGIEPNTSLNTPETFSTPNLCHLVLMNFTIQTGSPIFTTMRNLVTLSLNMIPPSAYFHPNALLQRLSPVPQLEVPWIAFDSESYPSRDEERQNVSHANHDSRGLRSKVPALTWKRFFLDSPSPP